jgi:fructose 1,6-bisphosphatase
MVKRGKDGAKTPERRRHVRGIYGKVYAADAVVKSQPRRKHVAGKLIGEDNPERLVFGQRVTPSGT